MRRGHRGADPGGGGQRDQAAALGLAVAAGLVAQVPTATSAGVIGAVDRGRGASIVADHVEALAHHETMGCVTYRFWNGLLCNRFDVGARCELRRALREV